MKHNWFFIAIFLLCEPVFAGGVRLQFDRVPVVDFVQVVYTDILKRNFVLDPKVTVLTDVVSVRFNSSRVNDVSSVVQRLLEGMGLQVVSVAGVDYIGPRPEAPKPSDDDEWQVFVYKPKFRDVRYLTDLLAGLVKGRFSFQRTLQAPQQQPGSQNMDTSSQPQRVVDSTSARAMIGRSDFDMLVYTGPQTDIRRLESLLAQVDIAQSEVIVKAYLYEVSGLSRDNSALNVVAKLLGNRININLGQAAQTGNWLNIDIGGLDVLASALSTDRRFKVLSNPSLRVRSGDTARLVVGNEVPVLGQFTTTQTGQLVQSVQYRSSGAILQVRPVVRDSKVIELTVEQQLSSFVTTTTGVNNSPTLLTREVSSRMAAKPGEVVLFAGLKDSKTTDERNGFRLLPFSLGKSTEDSESELLLMIEAMVL